MFKLWFTDTDSTRYEIFNGEYKTLAQAQERLFTIALKHERQGLTIHSYDLMKFHIKTQCYKIEVG